MPQWSASSWDFLVMVQIFVLHVHVINMSGHGPGIDSRYYLHTNQTVTLILTLNIIPTITLNQTLIIT